MTIQDSVPVDERVFRRSPLRAIIGVLLGSALLSTALLFIVPSHLPRQMSTGTRGMVVLALCVAGAIIIGVCVFVFANVRIVVRPDIVMILRPGKNRLYLREDTEFASKVTEHYTNGLRSGTTRALTVHSDAGTETVSLPGYTRAQFNELMSLLAPVAPPEPVDPVEAARRRASLPTQFRTDAGPVRRTARAFGLAGVGLLLLALATVALVFGTGGLEFNDYSALILIVPFAVLGAVGVLVGSAHQARKARSVPAQLNVTHLGLRIDDVDYPYAQLTRIQLTPPSYSRHRLALEPAAGRTASYLLSGPGVTMTPGIAELLEVLRVETARHPGLLRLDLE